MPRAGQLSQLPTRTLLQGVSEEYLLKLRKKMNEKMDCSDASGCWLWTGGRRKDPLNCYGFLYVHGKYTEAHRLSYAIQVEDFPIYLHVLHTCDNPPCIRPCHLFLGTNLDNMKDKAAKLRGKRKLDPEKVAAIFRLNAGGKTQYEIADLFGLSQASVRDVLTGATYAQFTPSASYLVTEARGSKNGNARLNESSVAEIKRLLAGGTSLTVLGKQFGVYTSTICSIRDGKTWRHVRCS